MNQLVRSRSAGAVAGVRRVKITSAGATTSGATTTISDSDLIASASKQSQEAIESAVYAHLQAMRALGHAFINTSDVAKALGLPQSLVDGTIAALKKRGVKVA